MKKEELYLVYKFKKAILFGAALLFILTFTFHNLKPAFAVTPQQKREREALVKDYVEQKVINNVVKMSGEYLNMMFKSANQGIMPAISYQASQQAAAQCFKQNSLREIIQDAFRQTYDEAIDQLKEGVEQSTVQQNIDNNIDKGIKPLVRDPVFQYVIEEIAKQTIIQQRKILTQQAIQMQYRRAIAQRMILQQALQQQLQNLVAAQLNNSR